jgi:hypothetical protein
MKVRKPVVKKGKGYWDIYINGKNVISIDYDFGTLILFLPNAVKQVKHCTHDFHTFVFRGAVDPSLVSSHSHKERREEG